MSPVSPVFPNANKRPPLTLSLKPTVKYTWYMHVPLNRHRYLHIPY